MKVLSLIVMGGEEAVAVHRVHGSILHALGENMTRSDVFFVSSESDCRREFPKSTDISFLKKNKRILTKGNKVKYFFSRKSFERELENLCNNYDLIITDGLLLTSFIAPFVKKLNIKCLTVMHGETLKLKPTIVNRIKLLDSKCFYFSCVSESVRLSLLSKTLLSEPSVFTIYNGLNASSLDARRLSRIDARSKFSLKEGDFVIGCVARIENHKGVRELFSAYQKVLAKFEKAKLLLIGDGGEYKAIKQLVDRAGLEGMVLMPGFLPSADKYLNAMDVFVLLSKAEGLGMVVLEAQLAGLPICLSDIPVFKEIVDMSGSDFCTTISSEDELVDKILNLSGAGNVEYDCEWFSTSKMEEKYLSLVNLMVSK